MRANAIGNKNMRTRKSEKSKEKSTTENSKKKWTSTDGISSVYIHNIQRDADLEKSVFAFCGNT